jgi:hypothetical protein
MESNIEELEIEAEEFCNRCSRIKQKLSLEKEDLANSAAVRQEFAVRTE